MQVVPVDWIGNYTDGEVVKVEVAGVVAVVPIGDVIELTEERSHPSDVRWRWVSKWEPADGD